MRSKLTVRGSEMFIQGPLSKTVKFKKPESMADIQRRAILQMREEEEARIKTEEEFKRDFLDFSYITGVDDYGLPLSTPYSVPDTVPDVSVPASSQAETQPETAEKGSLSKGDSGTESSGGSE